MPVFTHLALPQEVSLFRLSQTTATESDGQVAPDCTLKRFLKLMKYILWMTSGDNPGTVDEGNIEFPVGYRQNCQDPGARA